MYHVGDLPAGLQAVEKVALEQRLVFAVLDPQTPACDINKMIPDDRGEKLFSEDDVFTLYHCHTRQQIQRQWKEKLQRGGHKRYGLLGRIGEDADVQLAVSFRRYQQFKARDVATYQRIASLLDDVEGQPAINLLLAAYDEYRSEGVPAA
jgi:hypothetical protein